MKLQLRLLSSFAALAAFASSHAAMTLWYALPGSSAPLTSLTAPALGDSFTLSVWYASDTALLDGELFASYDRADSTGPSATPLDGKIGLADAPAASVSAAPGVALNGLSAAGGGGTGTRAYGLDILSVSSLAGMLAATSGTRLFDVTFKNLGLTSGQSATLSFYTSSEALYRTSFIDENLNEFAPAVGSLTVQAVPEPASMLGLVGGLALIRRRRRRR